MIRLQVIISILICILLLCGCSNRKGLISTTIVGKDTITGWDYISIEFENKTERKYGIVLNRELEKQSSLNTNPDIEIFVKQNGKTYCSKNFALRNQLSTFLPWLYIIKPNERIEIRSKYEGNIREDFGLDNGSYSLYVVVKPNSENMDYYFSDKKMADYKDITFLNSEIRSSAIIVK